MTKTNITCLILLFATASRIAVAADLLPDDADLPQAIDHYIDLRLTENSISPASSIDGFTFLRRVTLDLAGRIPTQQEVADFLAQPEETRRKFTIEKLLSSIDFAYHQRNELDLLLLARIKKDDEWRKYLLTATKENRSWSQIFKEVLTPECEFPGEVGPAAYLRERVRELDDLTNDTAVAFFGVNISCAKCHDHPLVADWQQNHYFGMASFFKRTYQTKSRGIAEDFQGNVKFTTVDGEEKNAKFMFLSNVSVEEPEKTLEEDQRKELEQAIKKSKEDQDAKAPEVSFSPRQEFVKLALEDESNSFFARNIVNRVWARLLGRGLVMPLDQMHSDNPASHPELMDWLVRDLQTHNYDLKRLIGGIVSSKVYARSCRWKSASEPPAGDTFARGNVRPLTPRQLALSLQIATTAASRLPGFEKPEDWDKQRSDLENRSNGFADLFQIPDENFQVGTDEALLFSNSDRFERDFLHSGDDRLIGQLNKIESAEEIVATGLRATLTREPTELEQQTMVAYLDERTDRREDAVKQLVWALLSSPEFRFNH